MPGYPLGVAVAGDTAWSLSEAGHLDRAPVPRVAPGGGGLAKDLDDVAVRDLVVAADALALEPRRRTPDARRR